MRRAHGLRRRAAHTSLGAAVLAAAALASPALAETAWIKDELRLNLRTGPGSQYRIIGDLTTGDSVEILQQDEEWTKIRANGEDGWIPAGYLQPEMPAGLQLARWQEELEALHMRVGDLEAENERLGTANAALAGQGDEQRDELEHLRRENLELRAGARWPEMAAGAGILAAGMILGASLQRRGRRSGPRIRI